MAHERVAQREREREREGDWLSVQAAGVLFKQAVIRASCWHTDRTCNCFYSSPCRRHTAKCRIKLAREGERGVYVWQVCLVCIRYICQACLPSPPVCLRLHKDNTAVTLHTRFARPAAANSQPATHTHAHRRTHVCKLVEIVACLPVCLLRKGICDANCICHVLPSTNPWVATKIASPAVAAWGCWSCF